MGANDYALWHNKIGTFDKYKKQPTPNPSPSGTEPTPTPNPTPKPTPAVDSTNSGTDVKSSGNVTFIYGDGRRETVYAPGIQTYEPGSAQDPNQALATAADPWAILGDILSQPKRLGTSLLLSLGTGAQAVRHLVQAGPDFTWDKQNKWLNDQLAQNWQSPFETSRIFNPDGYMYEDEAARPDLGTAFGYGIGQVMGLGTDVIGKAVTFGGKLEGQDTWDRKLSNQQAIQTFSQVTKDWGLTYSEMNFDPFSVGMRATITGAQYNPDGTLKLDANGKPITGDGWTIGNVMTQGTNFVGELALDPISYIPLGWVGKVGKTVFSGRRLLTGLGTETVAKHIATDLTEWTAIAGLKPSGVGAVGRYADKKAAEEIAGQKLGYWDFAKFAAENNANVIAQSSVIKSITSGEKEQIAFLLGKAETEQEVAKIFLATEYGSERAFAELVNARPNMFLALDEFMAGGYVARQEAKGAVASTEILDAAEHTAFHTKVAEAADILAKDDFSRLLSNVVVKSGAAGVGRSTVVRELMPSRLGLVNKVAETRARVGSFVVHGVAHDGSTAVVRSFGNGTSFLYHQVVRPFTTTAKGMIDLEDPVGTSSAKFFAVLGDIDRVTKSSLSQNGYRLELEQAWRTAVNPDQKAKVLQNAQELGLTLLARRHGFDQEMSGLISSMLSAKKRIFLDNLDRSGVVFMKDGTTKIVYHDPFMVNQTANKVMVWDFNKVNEELIKAKPELLGTGLVAKGAIQFKNGSAAFIRGINSLFQTIVLLRAGRALRDAFQNSVSSALSGYGGTMLKNGVNPGLMLDAVRNTKARVGGLVESNRLKILGFAKPSEVQKSIRNIDQLNDTIVEQEILRIEAILKDVASKKIDDIPYEDIPKFLHAAHEMSSDIHYHVTGDVVAKQNFGRAVIEGQSDRGIAVFNNSDDLESYIGTLGKDTNTSAVADSLTLPDTVGLKITKNVRTKVETAISDGEILHIRTAGRGHKWTLLDVNKFRGMTDAQLAKYEIRVVKPTDVPNLTTKQDLLNAIDRGDIVFGSRIGGQSKQLTRDEVELMTDVSKLTAKIFPKGSLPQVAKVRSYGKTVHLGSFKDLPEELATRLKITNQKDLDTWVANRGYDKLAFGDLVVMNKLGVGKFTVTQDGKSVAILNPFLTDVTGEQVNKALRRVVIRDLEDAGMDWTGLTFLNSELKTLDQLIQYGFRTASGKLTPALTPKYLSELTSSTNVSNNLIKRLGKDAKDKYNQLADTNRPVNAKVANLYGISDKELISQINASKQALVDNVEQKEQLLTQLIKSQTAWDKVSTLKGNRRHYETRGSVKIGSEDFAQSLAGVEGNIFMNKLASDVRDVRLFDALWKPVDGQLVTRVVKPNEEGYWEAWANVLNRNFSHDGSVDPVVKLILEKKMANYIDDESLVKEIKIWLETAEGMKYADAVGVGERYSVVGPGTDNFLRPDRVRFEGMDPDTFARLNIDNVTQHIGDISPEFTMPPELIAKLAKGEAITTQGFLSELELVQLSEMYGNIIAKDLLNGKLVTPAELQAYHLGRTSTGEAVQAESAAELLGTTNLPDIWASVTDPTQRTITQYLGRNIIDKFNKAVTDYPQQVFFQMPLFNAAYKDSLERQMLQRAETLGIGIDDVKVTEPERLRIVRNARQYALKETKKWIYSYTDGMKLDSALAQIIPFYNAFAFSLKTLANGARYNPLNAAQLVYFSNKLNNTVQWIDKNGQPVDFDEIDPETGDRKAQYVQAPMPEWFFNTIGSIPGFESVKDVKQIYFNRSSLDPVFQGNYTNAGFLPFDIPNPLLSASLSPIPTIALSEAVKAEAPEGGGLATDFTKVFNRVLPFGPSSEQWSLDKLIPGNAAKQALGVAFNNGIYHQAVLQAVQYVDGQYLLGEYPELNNLSGADLDAKLVEKAKAYAGPLFLLKAVSDFFSPVATSYITPGDIARKTFRANQDKAQAEYDAGGTTDAEKQTAWEAKYGKNYKPRDKALYLTMYENPEWWSASISPTFNQYGIEYNAESLKRLKEKSGLVNAIASNGQTVGMSDNDITNVLSWVVNDGPRNPMAVFDENSYAALQSDYLNPRTPENYAHYIRVQKGWFSYNNGYIAPDGNEYPGNTELRSHLIGKTTNPQPNDPIEPFVWRGQLISGTYGFWNNRLTNALYNDPTLGLAWKVDKQKSIDPNKFNNQADIWMTIIYDGYDITTGRPLKEGTVPKQISVDIAKYLILRKQYQTLLRNRGSATGRGTLSQNPDISARWDNAIDPFLNGSNPDFEDWYYKFFDGDTLN
jgi:hypothetical protein